jgi:hypothetical protein
MFTERSPHLSRLRVLASLLAPFAITAAVVSCSGKSSHAVAPTTVSSGAPTTPTTTLDPKTEVVARLREILRIRDEAISSRNAELFDSIYTTDCLCLRDGRASIQRLIKDRVVWKRLVTSIDVQKIQQVSERQWLVIGILVSSPVRIEKESGGLIRSIPGERNTFRFTLAKPPGADTWLLGEAIPLAKAG